jgi:beta-xylosidase
LFLAAALFAPASVAATAAERPFVPVYQSDFPDPFIVEHKGEYIAYSTNSGGTNLPMIASRDLIAWAPVTDSARPKKPLDVCQFELGGTIDAHPFRDADGKLYLYYKSDSNNPKVGKRTAIWVQPLADHGMQLTAAPVSLLTNDKPWEAHVIEAPTMVRRSDGGYTLFFSANHFGWEAHQRLSPYGMGYANCTGPMGPCTDAPDSPILYSYNDQAAGCLSGPGHQMVFEAKGRHFIAFHAWAANGGCRNINKGRYMYIAPLLWKGAKPAVGVSLRAAN